MADAPKILGTDTLRSAYPKLNSAIDNANEALTTAGTAKSTADTAKSTADTALSNSENTQTQLDTIVINGDSSVEAAQARVKSDGTTFTTLQQRLNDSDAQLADLAINVRNFGALGDGVTDDTAAIQAAIDHAQQFSFGIVFIPSGTYLINAHSETQGMTDDGMSGGILVKSNTTLILSNKAVLKSIPSQDQNYSIVRVYEQDNVRIIGGTIEGDKTNEGSRSGEWGYGINVRGSKNVYIENVTAKNCWGDGFYVARSANVPTSENVHIIKCIADGNRRQGGSIVGLNGGSVTHSVFKNTGGIAPGAGLDIEPNWNETCRDIIVQNNDFHGNALGIQIGTHEGAISQITVAENKVRDNASHGIFISKAPFCTVAENLIYDNGGIGIFIADAETKYTVAKANQVIGNLSAGISLNGSSNSIIKANQLYNNKTGIYLESTYLNLVEGNKVTESDDNGIVLVNYCNSNEILNNQVVASSQAQHNNYSGIALLNNASRNRVRGNVTDQGEFANKPKFGIQIASATCTENTVENNDTLNGGATAGISDVGTKSLGIKKTGIPTTGYWRVGDVVYNANPQPGQYLGWICVVDGTPGTWKGFGLIQT